MLDLDELMRQAVQEGVRQGVKDRLGRNYDNPLDRMLSDILTAEAGPIRILFQSAVTGAMGDPAFRQEIGSAVRKKLACILVSKFGGELEKHVNSLKSDPATRARITLAIESAIEGIIKERSPSV